MLSAAVEGGMASGATVPLDATKYGTCECPVWPWVSGACMATTIGDNLSIVVVAVV